MLPAVNGILGKLELTKVAAAFKYPGAKVDAINSVLPYLRVRDKGSAKPK